MTTACAGLTISASGTTIHDILTVDVDVSDHSSGTNTVEALLASG